MVTSTQYTVHNTITSYLKSQDFLVFVCTSNIQNRAKDGNGDDDDVDDDDDDVDDNYNYNN